VASFTAVFDSEQPYSDRDVWQAVFVVSRDGDYFQCVSVSVSGTALSVIDASEPPPGLMSSLARMSESYVRQAIEQAAIPLPQPTEPYEIFLDEPHLLSTGMAALTPPMKRGDVLWSFSS
jgi:hypothetical protein